MSSRNPHADDPGERAPTPEESLELIHATLRRAREELGFSEAPLYVAWGVAWVVAFGLTHLVTGGNNPPLGGLPEVTIAVVWIVAIIAASVFSGVAGARHGRGQDGPSTTLGRRIGIMWAATFTLAPALIVGLRLDGSAPGAVFVFTVAVLYIAMGAVMFDDLQLGTGLWIGAVNAVALFLSPDVYNLVLSILGGGALLVAGWVASRRGVPEAVVHAR